MDRAIVIDRLNEMADYLRNKSYSDLLARDFYDTVGYAILLLKEQEAVSDNTEKMLEKACETIAEFNPDFVCDDLMCDDAWCEEYCNAGGMNPECVKRWLETQIKED